MKLSPSCCDCCRESAEIGNRHREARKAGDERLLARLAHRRPIHGCRCRFRLPAERCSCAWCAECLAWVARCDRRTCDEPASFSGLCEEHRQQQRGRDRAAAARSAEIRRPPRPPWWDAPNGVCRLCGSTELEPRRTRWCSQACVDTWLWASTPAAAAHHLRELHGDACWSCGISKVERVGWTGETYSIPPTLELEHRRPLWSLEPEERLELRWWLPFNLQLLCEPCHRAKTKAEAAERAALRRCQDPG